MRKLDTHYRESSRHAPSKNQLASKINQIIDALIESGIITVDNETENVKINQLHNHEGHFESLGEKPLGKEPSKLICLQCESECHGYELNAIQVCGICMET